MRFRTLAALAAVAVAAVVPGDARAEDWGSGAGYDVSADLNASAAVTLDTFHEPLARYGEWVDVGVHGRAWRPSVAAGWRPYYYGRWEWTNEGWLWVSDEPWGWAAYHYGRWTHDPYYGWLWVPGYEWAPAWVSWRVSGDVIGWAPLSPGLSVYVAAYPFVDFWWTFVPTARFVSYPVYSVAYAPSYARRWWERTAPAPARPAPRPGARPAPAPRSALAWGGPAPRLVEERAGRPVRPVRLVPAQGPGRAPARAGEVSIYRPERRAGPPRGAQERGVAPAPARGGDRSPPPAARGPGPAAAPVRVPPPRADGGGSGAARSAPPAERGDARPPPAPGRSSGRGRGEERREERPAPPPRR